ncbi:MAG: hypothetical protein K6F37_05195 [Lachnospiraceae bacterium]|nr:hypothetical protein [Lachnospiraceae bacterium]
MEGYVYVEVDEKLRHLLNEIFSDEFMQENTNFSNFEGFQYSSAVITNWKSDQMVYAKLLMDNFVKESTRFESWDEMVMAATDAKFGKPKKSA